MRFPVVLIILLTYLHSLNAQTNVDNLKVDFKIKNIGVYTKGAFSQSEVNGVFNSDDLANSHLNVTIKVNSINTGIKKRDKHLLEDDYFSASTYPTIQFNSSGIQKKSTNNYIITGKLTIKKISKTIQVPLTIQENNDDIIANADFTISRKVYGVGGKSWVLSDKVKAQVSFTINKL